MAWRTAGGRNPTTARTARRFAAASGLATIVYAFELAGSLTEPLYTAVMVAALAAIGVGVWRNQPRPRLAWSLLFPISFLFAAGVSIREATGQNGDLSRSTITPDLVTVPGYLLFVVMLVLLIRSRQGGKSTGMLLDGLMFATGSLVVFYVFLIHPVLADSTYTTTEQVTFSIYPPFSAFIALLAARLAFSPGQRSRALQYFLVGVTFLFIGDVTQFLAETGTLRFPVNLLDLPYAAAFSFVGAAYLHPSIRQVASDHAYHAPPMRQMRLGLVATSLLIPCILLVAWRPDTSSQQTFVGLLAITLAVLGIWRIVIAINAQARSEAQLAYRATHDTLTGLPNRTQLLDTLATALAEPLPLRGVTVLLVDIDRFKLVNDTLGHRAGDALLISCAARVRSVVGERGVVGRVSGDELVVVIADRPLDEATDIAEEIRQSFTLPLNQGYDVYLTASIGVAHTTDATTDPVDLLRKADTAVYRSKDHGRNTVTVYTPEMLEVDERRFELEHALRLALGSGALEVHYQPIVSIESGRVEGFESLARWRDGDTWIPPVEFVPVAEDSGLISQLGTWVLRESVRQIARWRAMPELAHATVSVNLSARQLTPELADLIDDTLRASGLPGEALWLEITESMMVHNSDALQDLIGQIRQLGVRLSLDDFGTGFSSLSYLSQYPLDRLKIDRSFVSNISRETAHGSLADAIVSIGRSLRISTVAEGIETGEEALALRELGCLLGQGYYFARPMPAQQVPLSLNSIKQAWLDLGILAPSRH